MEHRQVLLIIIQALLSLITQGAIMGMDSELPRVVFWTSMAFLILTTFLLVHGQPKTTKLISLAILAISVSAIQVASSPMPWQLGRDAYFEAQYASLLAEGGTWDPTLGTGFAEGYYGYNPGVHFIMASISLISGIDAYLLTKYLFFFLFRFLIVACAYLVIDALLGSEREEVTFLATLLFIGSAGVSFIGLSRRTAGAIFVLLALYALIRFTQHPRKAVWYVLFGIFASLIVVSDHAVSYFFLLFLIGYWLYSLVVNVFLHQRMERKLPTPLFMLIFFVGMLFVWDVYVAGVLINADVSYIDRTLTDLGSGIGVAPKATGAVSSSSFYYVWELVMIYAAQVLFNLMGAVGLLTALFLSTRKHLKGFLIKPIVLFLVYLSLYGFIMYVLSSLLIASGAPIAGSVMLWFYGIPICILAAMFLRGNLRKASRKAYLPLVSIILLILFIGSLLMGVYTPRVVNRSGDADLFIEEDARARTAEVDSAAQWLKAWDPAKDKVLGDLIIYEIFSGIYHFDVTSYPESVTRIYQGDDEDLRDLILGESTFGNYDHVLHKAYLEYIVTNDLYFQYPSEKFGTLLRTNTLARYDRSPSLDRIYDNGQIGIYAFQR